MHPIAMPELWQDSSDKQLRNLVLNIISHNIRTPLNAAALNVAIADFMLKSGDVSAAREALSEVNSSIARLSELLENLIISAHIE